MVTVYSLIMSIWSSLLYAYVFIYRNNVCFSILFVQDFNIVLVFISFYINSFSFLFSFSSGFLSSFRVRERLPNHFRSRFSFVHENNTVIHIQLQDFSVNATRWMQLSQSNETTQPGRLTCSDGSGDDRLSNVAVVEHRRCFHIVPVLLGERINPIQVITSLQYKSKRC